MPVAAALVPSTLWRFFARDIVELWWMLFWAMRVFQLIAASVLSFTIPQWILLWLLISRARSLHRFLLVSVTSSTCRSLSFLCAGILARAIVDVSLLVKVLPFAYRFVVPSRQSCGSSKQRQTDEMAIIRGFLLTHLKIHTVDKRSPIDDGIGIPTKTSAPPYTGCGIRFFPPLCCSWFAVFGGDVGRYFLALPCLHHL
ncbi:hypothetical protein R1flu_028277 [Riccia fluitans]|uniref:Uncharacterized protein n=1 Tax=Riccia fluitans TaxID=41844 RepID=A0ABD1XLP5_9MARC